MSTGQKVKALLIPVWQLECCVSLLTDVCQGPTSPTWNINSTLKKQKLLQNQVLQNKSSSLKSLNEFPLFLLFSCLYFKQILLWHCMFYIWYIELVVKILCSLTLWSHSPCFIKIFSISNGSLPRVCWFLIIIWMVNICFGWSNEKSSNWAWERSQCSQLTPSGGNID